MNTNDITLEITGEMLIMGGLSKIIYLAPERHFIEELIAQEVLVDPPIPVAKSSIIHGIGLLQNWISTKWKIDPDAAFGEIETDHFRLFIGVGKVLAPPWESFFFNDERLIFQEQMLQVRKWYKKYGLENIQKYQEPDDHLALELVFLEHLSSLAIQALKNGNSDEFRQIITDQQEFISNHPIKWIEKWRELVDRSAKTDYYRGIAFMIDGVINHVSEYLSTLDFSSLE